MPKIFVSYGRQSEPAARSIVGDLQSLGHKVWFDRALAGGQVWWDQILVEIRDCEVLIFLLDPKSLNSVACTREYSYALALGKTVLPVLVAGGVSTNLLPPALSQIHFVDYTKQDRASIVDLARALTNAPPAPPLPDPMPAPPEVPTSDMGRLAEKVGSELPLTYEEQSAALLDLRSALREPATSVDAKALLERLRARRHLFAPIAGEIDEVLRDRRVDREEVEPKRGDTQVVTLPNVPANAPPWLLPAFVCAIAGGAIGAATILVGAKSGGDLVPAIAIVGLGGALAGAIAGRDARAIALVFLGAVVVPAAWVAVGVEEQWRLYKAIVFGAPIGMNTGALLGYVVWRVSRRQQGDLFRPPVTSNTVTTAEGIVFVRSRDLTLPNGSKFTDQQFEAYKITWTALVRLKRAGDDLWTEASQSNVVTFADRLREATDLVETNAIFFNADDYTMLHRLFKTFGSYMLGKRSLIEIRRNEPSDLYSRPYLDDQIKANGRDMEEYSDLVDRLRNQYHAALRP